LLIGSAAGVIAAVAAYALLWAATVTTAGDRCAVATPAPHTRSGADIGTLPWRFTCIYRSGASEIRVDRSLFE
jgi:hypothetical protein